MLFVVLVLVATRVYSVWRWRFIDLLSPYLEFPTESACGEYISVSGDLDNTGRRCWLYENPEDGYFQILNPKPINSTIGGL